MFFKKGGIFLEILLLIISLSVTATALPGFSSYCHDVGTVNHYVNIFTGQPYLKIQLFSFPTRNMDLRIALSYCPPDSDSKVYAVGAGFDILPAYILRENQTVFDYSFVQNSISKQIVNTSTGFYVKDGSNYKITYSQAGWTIKLPDGFKLSFNHTDSSTHGNYKWYLTKVEDSFGNYIEYHYINQTLHMNGDIFTISYLKEIDDLFGRKYVFVYSNRADLIDDVGQPLKKLDNITILDKNNKFATAYLFSYDYSYHNNLSLKNVMQLGKHGNIIPVAGFSYNNKGLSEYINNYGGRILFDYIVLKGNLVLKNITFDNRLGERGTYNYVYTGCVNYSDGIKGYAHTEETYPQGHGKKAYTFEIATDRRGFIKNEAFINSSDITISNITNTYLRLSSVPDVALIRINTSTISRGSRFHTIWYQNYDNYGNLLKKIDFGFSDVVGDERTDIFTYLNDIANWRIGLISSERTFNASYALLKQVNYTYGTHGELLRQRRKIDENKSLLLKYDYDGYGNLISVTNGENRTTYFEYNKTYNNCLLTKVRNELLNLTVNSYNELGLISARINPDNGYKHIYVYDEFYRIKNNYSMPLTNSSYNITYTYDLSGIPYRTIMLRKIFGNKYGRIVSYYDGFGNLIQQQLQDKTSGNMQVTDRRYDVFGNLIKYCEPYKTSFSNSFIPNISSDCMDFYFTKDPLLRIAAIKNYDGSFITYSYDAFDRVVKDEDGFYQKEIYNSANQLVLRIYNYTFDSANYEINDSYSYDVLGRLIHSSEQGGQECFYYYDLMGRVIKEESNTYGKKLYKFDKAGSPVFINTSSNHWVRYTLDKLGRPVYVNYSEHSPVNGYDIEYNYDNYDIAVPANYIKNALGHKTKMKDPWGTVYYYYDVQGRLVREKRSGLINYELVFDYDALDRVIAVTKKSSSGEDVVNYEYDLFGKLRKIKRGNTYIEVRSYYDDSNLKDYTLHSPDYDLSEHYSYYPSNRIRQMSRQIGGLLTYKNFTYDGRGNIMKEYVDFAGNKSLTTYQYDFKNRKTLVNSTDYNTGDSHLTKITYNSKGLIASSGNTTYLYDSHNRLTFDGSRNYSYNPDGTYDLIFDNSKKQWFYFYYSPGGSLFKVSRSNSDLKDYYFIGGDGWLLRRVDEKGTYDYYYLPQGILIEPLVNHTERGDKSIRNDFDRTLFKYLNISVKKIQKSQCANGAWGVWPACTRINSFNTAYSISILARIIRTKEPAYIDFINASAYIKGVQQLLGMQEPDGSWPRGHYITGKTTITAFVLDSLLEVEDTLAMIQFRNLTLKHKVSAAINKSLAYLESVRTNDSGWSINPGPYAPDVYTTALVIADFYRSNRNYSMNLTPSINWLISQQTSDGHWPGSHVWGWAHPQGDQNMVTAVVVRALHYTGMSAKNPVIVKALHYLDTVYDPHHGWGWPKATAEVIRALTSLEEITPRTAQVLFTFDSLKTFTREIKSDSTDTSQSVASMTYGPSYLTPKQHNLDILVKGNGGIIYYTIYRQSSVMLQDAISAGLQDYIDPLAQNYSISMQFPPPPYYIGTNITVTVVINNNASSLYYPVATFDLPTGFKVYLPKGLDYEVFNDSFSVYPPTINSSNFTFNFTISSDRFINTSYKATLTEMYNDYYYTEDTINLTIIPSVDIEVKSIDTGGDAVLLSDMNYINVTILNKGPEPQTIDIDLYINNILSDLLNNQVISAYTTRNYIFNWTPVIGTYNISVQVPMIAQEIDSSNNRLNTRVTVLSRSYPDIVVTKLTCEKMFVSKGQMVECIANISNTGLADSNDFNVELLVDNLSSASQSLFLKKGTSKAIYFTWNVTSGSEHTLEVVADSQNQQQESDENNNQQQVKINDYVIGTPTAINGNINNPIIEIGGTTNLDSVVSGKKTVKIKSNNNVIVEFSYNFSSTNQLNLSRLVIESQTNNDFGYILIRNLNLEHGETKTVYLDSFLSNPSVCIKDAEIETIGEISDSCTANDETLVICDGSLQHNYTCRLTGSKLKVTGLRHSGVKEIGEAKQTSGGGGSTEAGTSTSGGWIVLPFSNKTTEVRETLPNITIHKNRTMNVSASPPTILNGTSVKGCTPEDEVYYTCSNGTKIKIKACVNDRLVVVGSANKCAGHKPVREQPSTYELSKTKLSRTSMLVLLLIILALVVIFGVFISINIFRGSSGKNSHKHIRKSVIHKPPHKSTPGPGLSERLLLQKLTDEFRKTYKIRHSDKDTDKKATLFSRKLFMWLRKNYTPAQKKMLQEALNKRYGKNFSKKVLTVYEEYLKKKNENK